ncbi:hypothetical protein OROGR_010320 [Orobanche gracilis]
MKVKEKEKPSLRESFTATSRREMAAAAGIGLVSLLLPASSAQARPKNATMRQKIMDKFEELRQRAGLSHPKQENQEPRKNGSDEISTVPTLPNIINGSTVETSLP